MSLWTVSLYTILIFVMLRALVDRVCSCIEKCAATRSFDKWCENNKEEVLKYIFGGRDRYNG